MTRRTFLASVAAGAAAPALVRSQYAVATTCYLSYRRPKDTLEFLEYCNSLGAPGIQAPLTSIEPDYVAKVERRLKDLGMWMEVMSPLPRGDVARFTATLEAAKRIGALCVRSACLSGRRYENFSTLQEWRTFVETSHEAVGRAVPVADQVKLPVALENHKDWTVDEFVALLKKYDSQYLGACLDTGNNISLLDDPMEVIEKLAPWAVSTHIKDMGVAEYADGFLLSEVVIGSGMLDIPRMIAVVRAARPQTKLTLEMITRDPLKVPVFTEKYWATFPERSGKYVAQTMRMVREKGSKLPVVSHLSREEQLRVEEDNVKRCLATRL